MRIQKTWDSPIGRLLLAADEAGICEIRLMKPDEIQPVMGKTSPLLDCAVQQLEEYFAGTIGLAGA